MRARRSAPRAGMSAVEGVQPGCTGASDCPAPAHLHGCYADLHGKCSEPGEHLAPRVSGEWADANREALASLVDEVVETRRAMIQGGAEIGCDLPHSIADAVLAARVAGGGAQVSAGQLRGRILEAIRGKCVTDGAAEAAADAVMRILAGLDQSRAPRLDDEAVEAAAKAWHTAAEADCGGYFAGPWDSLEVEQRARALRYMAAALGAPGAVPCCSRMRLLAGSPCGLASLEAGELAELREMVAFLRAGVLDLSRDQIVQRITAVGSAEWRVGSWLAAHDAEVRERERNTLAARREGDPAPNLEGESR